MGLRGPKPSRELTQEDEQDILDRIESGELLLAIAEDMGVSQSTFGRWCEKPERFARVELARRKSAQANIEMAEREIRSAGDPFELAKARELAHHWRWKASKSDSQRFGDRIEHAGTLTIKKDASEYTDAELAIVAMGQKPAAGSE